MGSDELVADRAGTVTITSSDGGVQSDIKQILQSIGNQNTSPRPAVSTTVRKGVQGK
jgi:hypothetical protein